MTIDTVRGAAAMALTLLACSSAAGAIAAAAPAKAPSECSVASLQKTVAPDTTLVSAERLTEPVPYCSVEGYVTTQNPGPNKVGFLVGLPEQGWNGRFFFNSVGGSAGFLQTPPAQLIVAGYAVATTDAAAVGNAIEAVALELRSSGRSYYS